MDAGLGNSSSGQDGNLMKVLFVEDVPGTAYAGDIKEVKPGFARNYLLPRKLAVLATRDQMNRVDGLRNAAAKRRDATQAEMAALAEKLEGATVTLQGRAGRNDRLYGAITNLMVAHELSRLAGRDIDRRRVIMDPIRQLGNYEVPVKLHPGIEPRVKLMVVAPTRVSAEEEALLERELGAAQAQPPAPTPAEPAEAPAATRENPEAGEPSDSDPQ